MGVEAIKKILKCWLMFIFLVVFGYGVFFSCEGEFCFLYIIQKVSILIHNCSVITTFAYGNLHVLL